jgi:hypothetical protein
MDIPRRVGMVASTASRSKDPISYDNLDSNFNVLRDSGQGTTTAFEGQFGISRIFDPEVSDGEGYITLSGSTKQLAFSLHFSRHLSAESGSACYDEQFTFSTANLGWCRAVSRAGEISQACDA